jgi:hypothetical protein
MCDYDEYIRIVKFQNLMMDFELSFKSNKIYQSVLEHTSLFSANLILNCIKNEYGQLFNNNKKYLIELCSKNDMYGKPRLESITDFTTTNPSNIRYIYHSFLILSNISKNKINNVNLVEIGGGYGGLCFFIYGMAKFYNISISSYTIFDIKEVSILQKRYLKIFDIDINTYDINDDWVLNDNSYVISNYAFSEIPRQLQEEYSEKILNKYISYGFLIWNFIPVYEFIQNKNILIEDERPTDQQKNKFVYITPK